jgi:hypothetical protein
MVSAVLAGIDLRAPVLDQLLEPAAFWHDSIFDINALRSGWSTNQEAMHRRKPPGGTLPNGGNLLAAI